MADIKTENYLTASEFWEAYRLIEPAEASTVMLQRVGLTIAQQLYPHHDFEKDPIRFLISDTEEINAFFLSKGKADNSENIVAFSRGLIAYAPNLDRLAGVEIHELGHFGLKIDLGEGANSFGEERLADNHAVRGLHKTGFDAREYRILMQDLGKQKLGSEFRQVFDIHGTEATRVQDIDAQLISLGATVLEREPRAFEGKDIILTGRHRSYFDKLFEETGYHQKSAAERLEILTEQIPQITTWPRRNDIWAAHLELLPDLQKEQPQLIQRFVEEVWRHIADNGGIAQAEERGNQIDFGRVMWDYVGFDKRASGAPSRRLQPFAEFRELDVAIRDFIEAKDFETASDAAHALGEKYKAIRELSVDRRYRHLQLLEHFELNQFELPDPNAAIGRELPWQKHISWAGQDKSGPINYALTGLLGVTGDARLWTYEAFKEMRSGQSPFQSTQSGRRSMFGDGYVSTPSMKETPAAPDKISGVGAAQEYKLRTEDYLLAPDGKVVSVERDAAFADYEKRYRNDRLGREITQNRERIREQADHLNALHAAREAISQNPISDFDAFSGAALLIMEQRRRYVNRGARYVTESMGADGQPVFKEGAAAIKSEYYGHEKDQHLPTNDLYVASGAERSAPPKTPRHWREKLWWSKKEVSSAPARRRPLNLVHNLKSLERYKGQALSAMHERLFSTWLTEAEKRLTSADPQDATSLQLKQTFHNHASELGSSHYNTFLPHQLESRMLLMVMENRHGLLDMGNGKDKFATFADPLGEDQSGRRGSVWYRRKVDIGLEYELKLLENFSKAYRRSGTPEALRKYPMPMLDGMRALVGYPEPASSRDLTQLQAQLKGRKFDLNGDDSSSKGGTTAKLFFLEAYRYLQQPEKHKDFDVIGFVPSLYHFFKFENRDVPVSQSPCRDGNYDSANKTLFRQTLDNFLTVNDCWPAETSKCIEAYKVMEERQMFLPDKKLQSSVLDRIVADIDSKDSLPERQALAEQLLSGDVLFDPKAKNKVVQIWAVSTAAMHATDDGSPEYTVRMRQVVERLTADEKLNVMDRREMLRQLSDLVVAQPASALLLDDVPTITREKLKAQDNAGMGSEAILQLMVLNPTLAKRSISFLSKPKSEPAARALYRDMISVARRQIGGSSDKTNRAETFLAHLQPEALTFFHQTFTSLPLKARAYVMNRLLNAYSKETAKHIDLIDELLVDPKDPNRERSKRTINAYVSALEEYERSYLLSGGIAASGSSSGGDKVNLGAGIGLFCENRGPGEKKFGQQLNSLPIDSAIREGTEKLKGESDIPDRNTLYALYNALVPMKVRDQHKRLGKIVGGGSYWITAEVERHDGAHSVVQLLREGARIDAYKGLDRLEKTADAMEEPQSGGMRALRKADPIAGVLRRGARQAKRMVDVETSTTIGHAQAQTAHSLYDGTKISVDGHQIEFRVAPWLNYGEGYKEMAQAPGTVFAKLPDDKESDARYKYVLARGMECMEQLNDFRGGKKDHDRHGYQSNVERLNDQASVVWIYDTGAMALKKPGLVEKVTVANLMFGLSQAIDKGQSVGDYFLQATKRLDQLGILTPYVEEYQKGILARNDLIEYRRDKFDGGEKIERSRSFHSRDWSDILQAVALTNQIDPVIGGVLKTRIFMAGGPEEKPPSIMPPRIDIAFGNKPAIPEAEHVERAPGEATPSASDTHTYVLPSRVQGEEGQVTSKYHALGANAVKVFMEIPTAEILLRNKNKSTTTLQPLG